MLMSQWGIWDQNSWIALLWIISFFIFPLIYPWMQRAQLLAKIRREVAELEHYSLRGRRIYLNYVKQFNEGKKNDLEKIIDTTLEFFYIPPVQLDPYGVLRRLEFLMDTARDKIKYFVNKLIRNADPEIKANTENIMLTALSLNLIYKYARHYYIIGEKTKNIGILYQLEIILPQLKEIAKAYYNSFYATVKGIPIGDSVGPMVALRLIGSNKPIYITEEIIGAEIEMEKRKVIVIKAAGPGGRVGKPGEAIGRLIEKYNGRINLIVMIDAAQKLEGEKSATIAEGVGAAIGDPGPEKYKIEELATKYGIPVEAVIIKESIEEALSALSKKLAIAVDKAVERVKEIILEKVPEGGVAIVAGIGNTIGIGNYIG